MLRITVELHSAITGECKVLGVMDIANRGDSANPKRGNYDGRLYRKGSNKVVRTGAVYDYPRLAYPVWRLVCKMLKSMYAEEK